MPYFVESKRSGVESPATWTEGTIGDESGFITELSASSVILQTQSTNDPDNGLVAYQTISSGDIQLVTSIPSTWNGGPENFTFFGLQLRESLTGTPVILQNAWPNIGQARTKHRLTTDGSLVNNYATGLSGETLPRFLAITYDDSASEVKYFESDDNIDWYQIGDTVSVSLTYNVFACLYATSHDPFNVVSATLTSASVSSTITISDAGTPAGPRNVLFLGEFPQGVFEPVDTPVGGFRIITVPEPQVGSEKSVIAQGGDSGDGLDTRLFDSIQSVTPPSNGNGAGTTITPDYNTHAIWTQLDKNKDYTELNGGTLDKPRSMINPPNTNGNNAFSWGDEWYLGFVIHLPDNWEIEGTGRRSMFLQCQSQGASWTQFTLEHLPGTGSGSADDWVLKYNVNALSTRDADSNNVQTDVTLDAIADDIGTSTMFVMRFNLNPFSTTTNPATAGITDGLDESFPGNGGGMEVWKQVGVSRTMTKVFSLPNSPFGTVPHANFTPTSAFRLYKPTWKQQSTTVTGPIGCAFEAIYFGRSDIHSTTFGDVSADRSAEP